MVVGIVVFPNDVPVPVDFLVPYRQDIPVVKQPRQGPVKWPSVHETPLVVNQISVSPPDGGEERVSLERLGLVQQQPVRWVEVRERGELGLEGRHGGSGIRRRSRLAAGACGERWIMAAAIIHR